MIAAPLVLGLFFALSSAESLEKCTSEGLRCCEMAPKECPDADAPKQCRDEELAGITNGPGCKRDYIHSHCLHGKMQMCSFAYGCDCTSGNAIEAPSSSNATVHKACHAAGQSCCAESATKCPYPESGVACMDEIHQGIHNGPQCKNNYLHSHCMVGHAHTCLLQQQCDCSSLQLVEHKKATVQRRQEAEPQMEDTCSPAGFACCGAASSFCPYPESDSTCLAEIHDGIQNGPECRKNYIQNHCKAGHAHSCLVREQCNCLSLPQPPGTRKAMQGPREMPKPQPPQITSSNNSNISKGNSSIDDSSNSSSKNCTDAGHQCCNTVSARCPYPESDELCFGEIRDGIQNGPQCKKMNIRSHCKAERMNSCWAQERCDCSLLPELDDESQSTYRRYYAIPKSAVGNLRPSQTDSHAGVKAATSATSAAVVLVSFGLCLAALVTWATRRKPWARLTRRNPWTQVSMQADDYESSQSDQDLLM